MADLTGQRFGRLVVLKLTGKAPDRHGIYECKCDCGNSCSVRSDALGKTTKSCGCLRSEISEQAGHATLRARNEIHNRAKAQKLRESFRKSNYKDNKE